MKKGFTLSEVLITLSIVGIVASLTIPSVIVNYQNQEFTTGLQKALNTVNAAIQLNIADGKTPLDTDNLYSYLAKHMSITKHFHNRYHHESEFIDEDEFEYEEEHAGSITGNHIFYTADGMRFEIPDRTQLKLSETNNSIRMSTAKHYSNLEGCGSYGIDPNVKGRAAKRGPCVIMVDVNGDRPPNITPNNDPNSQDAFLNSTMFNLCKGGSGVCYFKYGDYKWTKPNEKRLSDVYNILITDKKAIPYGVVAQRMIYGK